MYLPNMQIKQFILTVINSLMFTIQNILFICLSYDLKDTRSLNQKYICLKNLEKKHQ